MSTCLSSRNGVKARKRHYCDLCGEVIVPGGFYDTRTGVDGSDMWTMKMHPECHTHEQKPGTVDPFWYDDITEPAFDRPAVL